MKTLTLRFSLFIGCILLSLIKLSAGNGVPPLPVDQGVSAPFAGTAGHWLIVGGGCNFPDRPAAEGGVKQYYQEVYGLNLNDPQGGWKRIGQLPEPVAYGATLSEGDNLYFIGGENRNGKLKTAYQLVFDPDSCQLHLFRLPDLPERMVHLSGTAIGKQLYVTGGDQETGGNHLYTIDLEKESAQWKKRTAYPGPSRLQSIVLGNGKDRLFLTGGYQPARSGAESQLSYDILCYHLTQDKWEVLTSLPSDSGQIPHCLAGGSGVYWNQQLILTGGVNSRIFKNALDGKAPKDYLKKPVDWYRFNDDVLVYHLDKQTWEIIPQVKGMAKAGGVLVSYRNSLYMICGETKPGIRCNDIIRLPLSDLFNKHSL